jgi:hypothetical protein
MLDRGAILHRFSAADKDPIHFDRSSLGRWNSPDAAYGVLYTADSPRGAFAETFLRSPGRRLIDPGLQARKAYARLEVVRPLTLIHLDGPGLAILGATAEVTHGGPPYDIPQSWSKALRSHPVKADGVAYSSRHDPRELCLALFDDNLPIVREIDRETDLGCDWFWDLADVYQLGRPPR